MTATIEAGPFAESGARAFAFRGRKLVYVWTRPASATRLFPAVLFLHGFPGAEKNVDIQRALLKGGVASLSLHFSGAWGSGGRYRFTTLIDDARAALRRMASLPGVDARRLGVFGFSMGGWTAINLAARAPRLKAVAAVAPVGGPEMDRGRRTRRLIAEHASALNCVPPGALYRDFAKAVRAWDPTESARRLTAPLLLVHGTEDELVPWNVSTRIRAAANGASELILVKGARHGFLDRRERLERLVSGWLLKKLRG